VGCNEACPWAALVTAVLAVAKQGEMAFEVSTVAIAVAEEVALVMLLPICIQTIMLTPHWPKA
jgi:2-methylcitrate dehydratase PrpD